MSPLTGTEPSERQNIVFFHPDLGIGGAERLIVDAAVGLQELGHNVIIYTSHRDPLHCFEEARDGTLNVRVHGNTIFPPTIFGRFHILLAILRQIHLILKIALFSDELYMLKPDVFIVDQLSACVPLLRWFFPKKQRTLFYCHFPDQLLARRDEGGILGLFKKLYRFPFDWFEAWSMSGSDKIVVNSNFTKAVSKSVFPTLSQELGVIYPCVNVNPSTTTNPDEPPLWNNEYKILLSINRFERKKDIGLAIRAYHALPQSARSGTRLIIAGGYDHRVSENVHYHEELVQLAEGLDLQTATARTVPTALALPSDIQVIFLLSVPGSFKTTLLRNARLLIYTPANEHFGIVPVEAMQYGVPVLAANTGGPLETIVEGENGWLRDVKKVDQWSQVMRKVLIELSPAELEEISAKSRKRVNAHFTRPIMAQRFRAVMSSMAIDKRRPFIEGKEVVLAMALVVAFAAGIIMAIVKKGQTGDRRASEFARIKREHATKSLH